MAGDDLKQAVEEIERRFGVDLVSSEFCEQHGKQERAAGRAEGMAEAAENQLRALRAECLEAIAPFATEYAEWDSELADTRILDEPMGLVLGDLRRAAALAAKLKEE